MHDGEEPINWVAEATAIKGDIQSHVKEIEISTKLPSDASNIFLNITTIEGFKACVNVSSRGFRIVSNEYDTIDENKTVIKEDDVIYETPYALLDQLSPSYVESFGRQLVQRLQTLKQDRAEFNEEEEEDSDKGITFTSVPYTPHPSQED